MVYNQTKQEPYGARKKKTMHDYKKHYFELFNGITDIIEMLQKLQTKAEREFIDDEGNDEEDTTEKGGSAALL